MKSHRVTLSRGNTVRPFVVKGDLHGLAVGDPVTLEGAEWLCTGIVEVECLDIVIRRNAPPRKRLEKEVQTMAASGTARKPAGSPRLKGRLPGHIHLPSIHVRGRDGSGFDYEEDIYVDGRDRVVTRTVRLTAIDHGNAALVRETFDILCGEELAEIEAHLDFFMDDTNPELIELMEARARREFARQRRIAAGREQACASCGCSESRACSGGCLWATPALCSRCL